MIWYEKFHFMCLFSSPNATTSTRSLKTHQLYLTKLESKLKTGIFQGPLRVEFAYKTIIIGETRHSKTFFKNTNFCANA